MNIMTEEWRPVVGWEQLYEVSNLGKIRNKRSRAILKGNTTNRGYVRISLPTPEQNKRQTNKYLHVIVLEAFIGPRPSGLVACHGPLGVSDNSVSNLSWATQAQNNKDRARDGTNNKQRPRAQGSKNHQAVLTEQEAKEIRQAQGYLPQWRIAKAYDVSPALVSAIHRGAKWRHLETSSPTLSPVPA